MTAYLSFKKIPPTVLLRDHCKIMRNCCSQVATSTVPNQKHTFDVNTIVCAGIEESHSDIVTVVELGWVNVIRSLPVAGRIGLLVRVIQQGVAHQDLIVTLVLPYIALR